MWLNGLILLTALVAAQCIEAELTIEAAFQGRCGHNSPCEQLCYEIHDGMYECDCTDGFELNKNGYSCAELNITSHLDAGRSEEDVLYQKGTSFSAKLIETDENEIDGELSSSNDNYDEENISYSESESESESEAATNQETKNNDLELSKVPETNQLSTATTAAEPSPSSATTTTASPIIYSNIDDDYYAKQDMSVYDDVNNNRLNLRQYNTNTYQNDPSLNEVQASTVSSGKSLNASTAVVSKTSSNEASSAIVSFDNCSLNCGVEGVCELTGDEASRMRCQCPFGKGGRECSEDIEISIPRFTKKSWLAFPALRGAYKHVQIRIEFRPESFDGIILLTGERDDLTGDFMAILIHQGFIEFWFDCGSGVGSVRSKETVQLNQWNSVTIYRHRWDAWLVLNHGARVQGRSKGLFSRITFREPVFLGGTGNITGLAKRLPINDGIVGCIRRFVANEHEYKFTEHPLGDVNKGFDIPLALDDARTIEQPQRPENPLALDDARTIEQPQRPENQDCTTDKCFKYPCQHGGKCLPSDQGAVCLCPLGFGGDLCEMRLDLQVPSFNGSSYLRYAPLGDSALIWLELKIIIKPHRENGIMLYSGHAVHGDYIALSLNAGFVEFVFDLGSGPAFVRSEHPISLGKWHTIKISRTARLAVLKVDQYPEVMTISSNGFWHLSLPHSLYLGGTHNVDQLPLGSKDKGSFVGCIQKLEINGRAMSIIAEALGGTNVDNCPHACVARPCGPLSQCVPILDNYECRCNPFSPQCNKAEEVPFKQINKKKLHSKWVHNRSHKGHKGHSKHYQHMAKTKSTTTSEEAATRQEHAMDWGQRNASGEVEGPDNRLHLEPQPEHDSNHRHISALRSTHNEDVHQQVFENDNDDDRESFEIPPPPPPPLLSVSQPAAVVAATGSRAEHEGTPIYRRRKSSSRKRPARLELDTAVIADGHDNQDVDEAGDYHAKELFQDMERIMKNSKDETISKDSNYGLDGTTTKRTASGACFTGSDSYFHYNDAETMSKIISYKIDLNLRFKTRSEDGVILWSGRQSALNSDDYLALGIENGYLHLRYNLGSGHIDIRFNGTRVSDGLWHRVRAMRNLQEGVLEVDGRKSDVRRSPGKLRQLNTDTGLYVGGMPDAAYYTRRRYQNGIVGCISEIVLAGELRLNLLQPATLGTAHNVESGIL